MRVVSCVSPSPWAVLLLLDAADRAQLLRNYEKREAEGGVDPFGDQPNGVHPAWLQAR